MDVLYNAARAGELNTSFLHIRLGYNDNLVFTEYASGQQGEPKSFNGSLDSVYELICLCYHCCVYRLEVRDFDIGRLYSADVEYTDKDGLAIALMEYSADHSMSKPLFVVKGCKPLNELRWFDFLKKLKKQIEDEYEYEIDLTISDKVLDKIRKN